MIAAPTLELVGHSATILVVDDEEGVLGVFEKLLPRRGLKIQTATTGEQAIALLKGGRFGCMLADKNLPGIDGLAVMREARKLQPYCAVIMMTGYSSTASAVEALRLGASDYLEKPFENLDLVVQKIEKALRSRRAEAERDQLFERIRTFEAELTRQNEQVRQQHAEIEMFNRLLEMRVREATEDLHKRVELLQSSLTGNKDAGYALLVHGQSILEFVRQIHLDDKDPIAIARAAITRIERRLDAHVGLARHLVNDEEEQGAGSGEKPGGA